MNIPDEAVEAAARALVASNLCPDDAQSLEDSRWGAFQQDARAALEAAWPVRRPVAARIWNTGYLAGTLNANGGDDYPTPENPYE